MLLATLILLNLERAFRGLSSHSKHWMKSVVHQEGSKYILFLLKQTIACSQSSQPPKTAYFLNTGIVLGWSENRYFLQEKIKNNTEQQLFYANCARLTTLSTPRGSSQGPSSQSKLKSAWLLTWMLTCMQVHSLFHQTTSKHSTAHPCSIQNIWARFNTTLNKKSS